LTLKNVHRLKDGPEKKHHKPDIWEEIFVLIFFHFFLYRCLDYWLVPKQSFVQLLSAKTCHKYIETTLVRHIMKKTTLAEARRTLWQEYSISLGP